MSYARTCVQTALKVWIRRVSSVGENYFVAQRRVQNHRQFSHSHCLADLRSAANGCNSSSREERLKIQWKPPRDALHDADLKTPTTLLRVALASERQSVRVYFDLFA